ALHYLGAGVGGTFGPSAGQRAIAQGLFCGAGLLFFVGARLYSQRKAMVPVVIGSTAIVVLWSLANAFGILPLSVDLAAVIIYGAVGFEFWTESQRQETLADGLLCTVFFAWSALRLVFLFFQRPLSSWNITFEPLSALPATFAAMLM